MAFSPSKTYVASNPRFALTRASRPKIQRGQMTLAYAALEPFGSTHSLADLVRDCLARDYKATFKNPSTDIRASILSHLNRLQKAGAVRECT